MADDDEDAACLCRIDDDGLVDYVCDQHSMRMWHNEYRMRAELDVELDAVVRELAGRAPTRIERKVGATGTFAIARPK
jgi:hypothetical protein